MTSLANGNDKVLSALTEPQVRQVKPLHVILCNGASQPSSVSDDRPSKLLKLEYRTIGDVAGNVRIGLPRFINDVYHLPDRLCDLLEIAAYVYCADRCVSRGKKDDAVYESWARSFRFVIRVRDYDFWSKPEVGKALSNLLTFLAGDEEYRFDFEAGHNTPATSLFDHEGTSIPYTNSEIVLFSGGLDSLAGVTDWLRSGDGPLFLVSHQSGNPGVMDAQRHLIKSLMEDFPDRIKHYPFKSGLTSRRDCKEETQRTRFFLYASIGLALAASQQKDAFYVYENGITSLNFAMQQSTINGRASRTTHPKTISLLQKFFSVLGKPTTVETPFFWKTKTDVLNVLKVNGFAELYDNSLSCAKAFNTRKDSTHCGVCSQCVDRRMAAYASDLGYYDSRNKQYATDFMKEGLGDTEARTTLKDYLRLAAEFDESSVASFERSRLYELTDLVDYLNMEESEAVRRLWELCKRHGRQVLCGVRTMRFEQEELTSNPPVHSLFQIVNDREFLRPGASGRQPRALRHPNRDDIVVDKPRVDEVVREHHQTPNPLLIHEPAGLSIVRHSEDWSRVNVDGTYYHFKPNAAKVVQFLWASWWSGCPDVTLDEMRNVAGTTQANARDIFEGTPNWQTWIVRSGRALYRLKFRETTV